VNVKIPGYSGPLNVCALDAPVCDFIIGNDWMETEKEKELETDEEEEEIKESLLVGQTFIFENSDRKSESCKIVQDLSQTKSESGGKDFKMGDTELDSSIKNDVISYETVLDASGIESSYKETSLGNTMNTELQLCEEASAVQTRQQNANVMKSKRPLKVTVIDALSLSPENFRILQETDEKLVRYWDLAKNPPIDIANRPSKYVIKHGLLYRVYKQNPHVDEVRQLVVPRSLEQKVISFAHDTVLSCHGSQASTLRKLCKVFFIPGASGKCRDYVKSCLLCQKVGNKNVYGKAPMMSMPQISEPFNTVYVDLVGEIHPASAEGHGYILCATDACTHFPMAIPLKKTDSVTIAEAMLSQFNLLGHPKNLICDNASNLTSEILREIYHVYGIKIKTIPVYRPESNSIQERSHGEIKKILRKLCVEQPKQWHRYIDPLMFSIRKTENTNGFTPFELLFGRLPHTHLNVLRELWTGRDSDPDVKTTYHHELDLRNRIEETCELAHKEIAKTHLKNKRHFDKNAKLRELKVGDKVLVLSPKPKNKLEFLWKGPAEVIERKGVVNYRIRFDSNAERTYHVNMLKLFISREPESFQVASNEEINAAIEEQEKETSDEEFESDAKEVSAVVMGLVECSDDETIDDFQCKEESSQMELYNSERTETWRDVQVNSELSEGEKQKSCELLEEFQDIFSDVPTQTHLITHKIRLKSDEPVYSKPYKIPVHMVDRVNDELDLMLKQNINRKPRFFQQPKLKSVLPQP
jgi:Integrase zinc binding domain/Integrase core domain